LYHPLAVSSFRCFLCVNRSSNVSSFFRRDSVCDGSRITRFCASRALSPSVMRLLPRFLLLFAMTLQMLLSVLSFGAAWTELPLVFLGRRAASPSSSLSHIFVVRGKRLVLTPSFRIAVLWGGGGGEKTTIRCFFFASCPHFPVRCRPFPLFFFHGLGPCDSSSALFFFFARIAPGSPRPSVAAVCQSSLIVVVLFHDFPSCVPL